MKHVPITVAIAALVALGGCQVTDLETPAVYLDEYNVPAPTSDTATVCHGYTCRYQSKVKFTAADFKGIEAILAKSGGTAAGERVAMSEAIGFFENITGRIVGTANDEGGVLDNKSAGDPTKMDCIDEAATATSYLVMMNNRGMIKHHEIVKPQIRGMFIDGRWQHYTAVVREKESGRPFAIDSWFRPNGQPAVVMTLDDWLNDYEGVGPKQLPKMG